jgi:acyl carrier protein
MENVMTSGTATLQRLRALPRSERKGALEALVVAEVKASLLMTEQDELPGDQSYFELGLNSLGVMEIKQRLEAQLGCRIDAAVLFNHPTVSQLLAHLMTDALRELFPPAEVTQPLPPVPEPAAETGSAEDSSPEMPSQKDIFNGLLKRLYET